MPLGRRRGVTGWLEPTLVWSLALVRHVVERGSVVEDYPDDDPIRAACYWVGARSALYTSSVRTTQTTEK